MMDATASADSFDLAACSDMMRGGSKTFFAASLMLPRRVRAPAAALYAFCRVADDAIDLSPDCAVALAELRQRLDGVYAGQPRPDVADRALAAVVRHAGIPRSLLDALLEGFAWDAQGRRYETIEEVCDYGARVAGTVGAMMSLVMGARSAAVMARASELGVAMQLTNIARDVGEDARNGRLYLPLDWLREAGVEPDAWLAAPEFNPGIASVVQRVLSHAEALYRRAECGVAALPRDCRPAIQAARLVYAEIGRQIESAGLDSVSRRAVVPPRRKLALTARATLAALSAPGGGENPAAPIPAVRFLVQMAASPVQGRPRRGFYHRTVRVIELFEVLQRRHRGRIPTATAVAYAGSD